jgi:chromate reductase
VDGTPFRILGIAGSLRERSYNRALLRAAAELVPPGCVLETFDLRPVPLYNGDEDPEFGGQRDAPEPVVALRRAIVAADAVVLAVPEYNWGPSGVMKNAIDWASRPPRASSLYHKPVALMGTSRGPAGTGRAQLQIRQALLSTRSHVLVEPDVQLGGYERLFDAELRLVDEEARTAVARQLDALVAWARLLGAG